MNQITDPKRVTTGQCRLSYVHLLAPRPPLQGGTPKYSVTVLIPKSDISTKAKIDAAVQAAIQDGVQRKWGGVRPAQPPVPVYDGDGLRPGGEPFSAECKGHWVLTCTSERKPEIVDLACNHIIDADQIYSGMYGRVSMRFFPYAVGGKKGIGCGLGNVQKVADGEPLASRYSAEDDFGQAMPTPAQPYKPQPYQAAPAQPAYPAQPTYPAYPTQTAQPAQPAYPTQTALPAQPAYPTQTAQPAQPQQPLDPITGKPAVGPVYGL